MTTGFVERIKGKVLSTADSVTQMGKGGALFKSGGMIYVNSSSAGLGNTSDTTSDTLDTYSMPGNSLQNNNYMLTIQAFGTFAANAHANKVAALWFGSESVTITYSTSVTGGTPWALQMNVFKTGANTQFITAQTITGTVHGGITYQSVTPAETDTSAIVIKVSGQTPTTAAANDVVLYGWFIEASNY